MPAENPAKYTQYSTHDLEKILSNTSDKDESRLILTELGKRYQEHYYGLVDPSGKSNSASTTVVEDTKVSAPKIEVEEVREEQPSEPKYQEDATFSAPKFEEISSSRRRNKISIGESLREGVENCVNLIIAAILPLWLVRIFIHPILTVSKLVRLIAAVLMIPFILIINVLLSPISLIVGLVTLGKVNLFEKWFLLPTRNLYQWAAPKGFWKD